MRKKEIIFILFIILSCSIIIGLQLTSKISNNRTLMVEVNNERIMELPLTAKYSDEVIVPLKNGEATILIEDGKVKVLPLPKHTCPNGICYAMGWIEKPGETIICLPNKMVLSIIE